MKTSEALCESGNSINDAKNEIDCNPSGSKRKRSLTEQSAPDPKKGCLNSRKKIFSGEFYTEVQNVRFMLLTVWRLGFCYYVLGWFDF